MLKKPHILTHIGIKGPFYRVSILANGLVNISRCKGTSYRHGGAMGATVHGDIVEGS